MLDSAYIFCKLYLLQLWCIVVFSVVCHFFVQYMWYTNCRKFSTVHVAATSTLLLHTVATSIISSFFYVLTGYVSCFVSGFRVTL